MHLHANTVIECIVRCTPIIINPLDSVVEYLGNEYPLYYTNMVSAVKLIHDLLDAKTGLLLKTTLYLTKLNHRNKNLHIKTFMFGLRELLLDIKF